MCRLGVQSWVSGLGVQGWVCKAGCAGLGVQGWDEGPTPAVQQPLAGFLTRTLQHLVVPPPCWRGPADLSSSTEGISNPLQS